MMLAGPSYSFKSFLLLDWLLSMVSNRRWNGKFTAPAKVAYVLGEGKSSLLKRAMAWMKYHEVTSDEEVLINERFRACFEVPQLGSKASVDNFLADLAAENFKPDVIAIDTFARAMVGKDENDQKDVGLWIEQADRLRQLGYTVIFLHHTKKSIEFGVQYRGSTAIMGAMDTAMTLTRNENYCTLNITKQKDHDEGPDMRFRRVLVDVNGETSCVLVPSLIVDERFEEVERPSVDVKKVVSDLISDEKYPNDTERAKKLSEITGKSLSATKSILSRAH